MGFFKPNVNSKRYKNYKPYPIEQRFKGNFWDYCKDFNEEKGAKFGFIFCIAVGIGATIHAGWPGLFFFGIALVVLYMHIRTFWERKMGYTS